jgi:nucleoside-diphosphate-sugar epimerase
MNIFLSGHKGYLGRSIKEKLIGEKYEIKTLENKINKKTNINFNNINCIIHSANKFNSKNKDEIFKVNYMISKKIFLEAIRIQSKDTRLFINLNTTRINENLKLNKNYYIESKKKFSSYVKKNIKKRILFIDLLIPTVFGNIGNNKDFYSTALIKLKKDEKLKLKNPYILKKFIKLDNLIVQILKIIKKYKNSKKLGYVKIEVDYNFKKTILEFSNYLKIKLKSKSKIYF